MNILVTGATGYIGGRLIPRLLERGHHVRCLARSPCYLAGRPWNIRGRPVEVAAGDALDPASLPVALDGIEIAYYLIHSMAAREDGFADRDCRAAENFAAAARAAGVRRIIYLGALGRDDSEPGGLSDHLRNRQEVGRILAGTGIPVTEFRAAIIVGSGSISFEIIRYLVDRLPVIVCSPRVFSLCQPIAIRDVLAYLIQAVGEPLSEGRIIEIGGRDVLSYAEMLMGYARARGLRRRLLPLKFLTVGLAARWVDLITPIPAAIARPLIEGLRNSVVCTDEAAREIFSIRPMGYMQAVELALARIHEGAVETIWSGAQSSLLARPIPVRRLEVREGMMIERNEIAIRAPAEDVFRSFASLGGERGWLFADWLWKLRGLADRLLGGFGMRRGRRSEKDLQVGDPVDFWRVEALEPGRLLRFRMEMKMPGKAWLQFDVAPRGPARSVFAQSAFFEPKGLMGLAYWFLLDPIHRLIFFGLRRQIKLECERGCWRK